MSSVSLFLYLFIYSAKNAILYAVMRAAEYYNNLDCNAHFEQVEQVDF